MYAKKVLKLNICYASNFASILVFLLNLHANWQNGMRYHELPVERDKVITKYSKEMYSKISIYIISIGFYHNDNARVVNMRIFHFNSLWFRANTKKPFPNAIYFITKFNWNTKSNWISQLLLIYVDFIWFFFTQFSNTLK